MRSRLLWRQLHWPRPLDAAGALAALRVWAADQRSPLIVLEARAQAGTVEYLLGSTPVALSAVGRQLTTAVPAARLTTPDSERTPVMAAGRLKLSTRHRALASDQPEALVQQILGALQQTGQDELLVLQLLLGPRRIPLAIPNHSPSSIVMPWYQVAWQGNGGTVDGEKRAALRNKVGQHGFASTLRIGAIATDPRRRRWLIYQLFAALRTGEAPGVRFDLVPGSAAHLNAVHVPWRWPLRLNVSEVLAVSGWPVGDDELPGLRRFTPARLPRRHWLGPVSALSARCWHPAWTACSVTAWTMRCARPGCSARTAPARPPCCST